MLRIDKEDDFPERKEFWRKLGNMGLLGITASSQYGGTIPRFLIQMLGNKYGQLFKNMKVSFNAWESQSIVKHP